MGSYGFLNYLLKDGAFKNEYTNKNITSKRVIRDALIRQCPKCPTCNVPESSQPGMVFYGFMCLGAYYPCTACSIACTECKLGKWMEKESLQEQRMATEAEATNRNAEKCIRCGNKGIDKCRGTGHDTSELRDLAPNFFPTVDSTCSDKSAGPDESGDSST